MISGNFTHCTTLQQFYDEIVDVQTDAHGRDYCTHHAAIQAAIVSRVIDVERETVPYEGMKRRVVYKELGVNQGATAAAAVLAGATHTILIDVNLEPFRPYEHLFQTQYTLVQPIEQSSHMEYLGKLWCDVLFVDTVHIAEHVARELEIHAPTCWSTIIIHDTGTHPNIHTRAVEVLKDTWDSVKYDTRACGFSVFFRKPR